MYFCTTLTCKENMHVFLHTRGIDAYVYTRDLQHKQIAILIEYNVHTASVSPGDGGGDDDTVVILDGVISGYSFNITSFIS